MNLYATKHLLQIIIIFPNSFISPPMFVCVVVRQRERDRDFHQRENVKMCERDERKILNNVNESHWMKTPSRKQSVGSREPADLLHEYQRQ